MLRLIVICVLLILLIGAMALIVHLLDENDRLRRKRKLIPTAEQFYRWN